MPVPDSERPRVLPAPIPAAVTTPYTGFDRWVAELRFRQCERHVRPGARVCDLGCGVEALLLARLNHASFRVGVDYQRTRPMPAGVHIVQSDFTADLPLRSGGFDCVTLLAVIEHLEHPESVLREAHRILAPGGTLVVTWPSAAVDPLLVVLCRLGIVSPEMESRHHQPRRPPAHWTRVLEAIGFRDIRHRTFEFGLNHLLVANRPGS